MATQYQYLSNDELEYVLLRIYAEIKKYAEAANVSYDDTNTSYKQNNVQKVLEKIEDLLEGKVNKEDGKGLSENDFTKTYKDQLDGLATTLANYMKISGGTFTGPIIFNDTVTIPDAADGTKDGTAANTKFVDKAIQNALKDVAGISFDGPYSSYEVLVQTITNPKNGVIYLVTNQNGSAPNSYDEYFWNGSSFELFGSTSVDLTGYVKVENMHKFTQTEIDDAFTKAGFDAYTPTTGA